MVNNAERKLILHVGLPKTGTTALQKWLHIQRHELRKAGITYPERHAAGEYKHNFIVREALRGEFRLLRETVAAHKRGTLLLSNEGLSNHFYDFSREMLEEFRDITFGMERFLILVSRNKSEWVRSFYKQCVVNPKNGASDLWGTTLTLGEIENHPRIIALTNYEKILGDMAVGYGAQEIFHLAYEEDWFGAILDILGVGELREESLPRINDSLPVWAVEFLRQVNRRYETEAGRRPWKEVLQAFLASNHTVMTGIVGAGGEAERLKLDRAVVEGIKGSVEFQRSPDWRGQLEAFVGFIDGTKLSSERV